MNLIKCVQIFFIRRFCPQISFFQPLIFFVCYVILTSSQIFLVINRKWMLISQLDHFDNQLHIFGFLSEDDFDDNSAKESLQFLLCFSASFTMTCLDCFKFQINSKFTRRSVQMSRREILQDQAGSGDTQTIESLSNKNDATLLDQSQRESFPEDMHNRLKKNVCFAVIIISMLNLLQFLSLTTSVTYQDGLPGLLLSFLFSVQLILLVSKSKTNLQMQRMRVVSHVLLVISFILIVFIYFINCQPLASWFSEDSTWKLFKLLAKELYSEFNFDSKRFLVLSCLLICSCMTRNYFFLRILPFLSDESSMDFLDQSNFFEKYALNIIESYLLPVFKEVESPGHGHSAPAEHVLHFPAPARLEHSPHFADHVRVPDPQLPQLSPDPKRPLHPRPQNRPFSRCALR